MKTSLATVIVGLLLTGCTVYQTKGPEEAGTTRDLTPVCHAGSQTLRVEGDDEVREHLAHGDRLGQCPVPESDAGQS